MDIKEVNDEILTPSFRVLAGGAIPRNYDTPEARVMLLAIGLQESRFLYRRQIRGPARGWWQFENGGGVKGVINHRSSAREIDHVLGKIHVAKADVYTAIEWHDQLATVMARLLLYTDPKPLPAVTDTDGAWALYSRVWRPGKPHPETWPAFHKAAVDLINSRRT